MLPSKKQSLSLLAAECKNIEESEVALRRKNPVEQTGLKDDVKLFPHQHGALSFLSCLFPRGAILADEMGLGKTLETLAFLAWLRKHTSNGSPFLVVCPLTLVDNWAKEIARFTTFSCVQYIGNGEERSRIAKAFERNPQDILVSSYEIVLKDAEFVQQRSWAYLVVDEGHRLKNAAGKMYQVLEGLRCPKLLLTGTPVHNDLRELWNLLHFVQPEVFRDASVFEALNLDWRKNAQSGGAMDQRLVTIHEMLRLFMLRRKVEECDIGLPKKVEIVLKCDLSDMQRSYYRNCLLKNFDKIRRDGNSSSMSNVVMNLRKVCNHPYLFEGAEPTFDGEWRMGDHIIENSGKMLVLDLLLRKLHRENKKVCIFSTMTRVLDILQDYLSWRQYNYVRLDGSVRAEERFLAVNEFQNEKNAFVFLLSTRAGGVGLNLTAASFVIFFDQDWNPQMDLQAQARAHRIGQKQEVTVVRLLCRNSVEEIVFFRARKKLFLAEAVVEKGRGVEEDDQEPKMSSKELLSVIQYGLADLDNDTRLAITESDVAALLDDAREAREAQEAKKQEQKESSLKRAKTFVRVKEQEREVGLYDWEGVDVELAMKTRTEEDEAALKKLLESAPKSERRQSISPLSGERKEAALKKQAETAERKRAALLALWERNSYVSKKLPDVEELDSFGDELEGKELTCVNGNCLEARYGGNERQKIIVVVCDASGEFGRGSYFESMLQLHGSQIADEYLSAKLNKDLHVGDCHLLPSSQACVSIALVIGLKSRTSLNVKALGTSLRSLSAYARTMNATIHTPRLVGKSFDWYSAEHLLRQCFSSVGVECFVYYFKRRAQKFDEEDILEEDAVFVGNSNDLLEELPDFLVGYTLMFDMENAKKLQVLARHAIAFGAIVVESVPLITTENRFFVVSDKSLKNGAVREAWLEDSFESRCVKDPSFYMARE